MAARSSSVAHDLARALGAGDLSATLRLAGEWVKAEPRATAAWMALGQARLATGDLGGAGDAFDRTLRLAAGDSRAELMRAIVHHRLGRSAVAIETVRRLMASDRSQSADAALALAEMLDRAGRHDELAELCASNRWTSDPRGVIFTMRVLGRLDPARAAQGLLEFARSPAAGAAGTAPLAPARRIAGFDAVRLLDRMGEYRQAYDVAVEMHRTTGAPFDTGGLVAHAAAQGALLERGGPWFQPRGPQVRGFAFFAALPRSGTTLLEHMLDAHSAVSGIGEYEGVHLMGQHVVGLGIWPERLGTLPARDAQDLQTNRYLSGARARMRDGATWCLDKSLQAWQWLPAIASILPGSVVLRMTRDPRDAAISMLLSNFHPRAFGWTSDIASIRRVVQAERALVPRALELLGLRAVQLSYEELVSNPAQTIARCLAAMDLEAQPACLVPEANARTVLTLSHAQVRAPISKTSIGRWRHYEFAFDTEWERL